MPFFIGKLALIEFIKTAYYNQHSQLNCGVHTKTEIERAHSKQQQNIVDRIIAIFQCELHYFRSNHLIFIELFDFVYASQLFYLIGPIKSDPRNSVH